MATPQFHPLRIRQVRPETADALTLSFDVPPELRDTFRFTQGQFVTLRAEIDGEEARRSYSICAGVDDYANRGELRVGIKRVPGGRFSNFVHDALQPGHTIDVMPPDGRFYTPLDPSNDKHYVGFCAGSGITPMIALIKSALAVEPYSRFTLVYGNRSVDTIMFAEELEDLKNRYLERFTLYNVLSGETQDVGLFNGRIDADKCREFLATLLPAQSIDEAFICGPGSMMDAVEATLREAGVPAGQVHAERFGVPGEGAARRQIVIDDSAPTAELVVILDGSSRTLRTPYEGQSVLDTGLKAGLALPYACKGGVCCTCRAKVVEGKVAMDKNYTLEEQEVADGFVLTCQARPLTERVVVSYDER
ncbi:1,2-phenylacetyl-CoA epoxidase subunit PaaE [Chitinasiproducens palmae]|uniref:Ring-1,2-phenylacetyl-CoA epoxidase subunit PaaE n=1 Tax=Chitinasiproducens palmae TaxID=1770053 RepID=A0A1H2PNR1_9BURK|nr:1,2-phenylacetyl-CoA epoxidase subunit PaaE [Chitinasiproducens palmae]SDV48345.1 ring-1,2-phenylacetyl-CoA epoxidase subunit PaaE [Chitinasiproducens palmae]